jgi:hypothetical protein
MRDQLRGGVSALVSLRDVYGVVSAETVSSNEPTAGFKLVHLGHCAAHLDVLPNAPARSLRQRLDACPLSAICLGVRTADAGLGSKAQLDHAVEQC